MSLTEDQIKQVKSLQKKFNAELDKFLQDWTDTVKNAFETHNFSNEYIQVCMDEHMAWLDRKVKEYESRN